MRARIETLVAPTEEVALSETEHMRCQPGQVVCPPSQGLPFLAVGRVFDVHRAGDSPFGRADVVEGQIRLHVP